MDILRRSEIDVNWQQHGNAWGVEEEQWTFCGGRRLM